MPTRDLSKIKQKVRTLPHQPGVYLMKDRLGSVLYVGKAKDLKKRVSTYFQPGRRTPAMQQPKISALLDLIYDFETIEVKNEAEALLLEGRLIKEWKPKYNTDFTDDKRFLLVRVDLERALPRFRLARVRNDERSLYFGPFAHSGLLRKTLHEMRRKFGILLGDSNPKRLEDGRWQLYDDVRGEIYGHTNIVDETAYRKRVEEACVFLEGKSREWLKEIREEMQKAAEEKRYENAAELRDLAGTLETTIRRTRKFVRNTVRMDSGSQALEGLQETLELPTVPETMECFDISHISGNYCVASMVQFLEGLPAKANYRRYQIKSFVGNDDFRAMEEVVRRRYQRLMDEGRKFPDLIVIDGGVGQVSAALKGFISEGIEAPPLIGLAKKEETIVFSDGRKPLKLPASRPELQLLQRLRDEAHRFANTYNAELRGRRIRETILDDFEGIGPVRRKALLKHFKTLQKLRSASVEELSEVEGIGLQSAEKLYEFLHPETTGTSNNK